jgi:hypothetical protein
MGLGLSASHDIICDHDGSIEVESTSGYGSLFRVQLPRSPQSVRARLLMAVLLGEPEEARRCRFGIELDEYRRLVTDDPGVVRGLNDHNLWRDELEGAAVGILATYVAPSQEADVRVHAKHCADERLEVR